MQDQQTAMPNADQLAYWNGDAGDKWARLQARLDDLFAPIGAAAVAAAGVRQGDRVLDVGCGCGDTVLALAEAVGPLGAVTGVDISAPMLAVAGRRIAGRALPQAAVLKADAATEPFSPGTFDLAFSRFGVMFFDAPSEAFVNIRRALAPGGRLFFACWRPFSGNPWFHTPYKAAVPHLPEQDKPDPDAPGPFAFADPERVKRILGVAGFGDVEVAPFDATLRFGRSGDIEDALRFIVQIGPVARALATGTDAQKEAALAGVRDALRNSDGPDGIGLGARCWFVSAVA
ncbi:class I SAM-dependent methyltransferase [Lichenibacterium minor]|uniref:Class I SAM-dependent methyltransferase n=1 Tax=Lichenibacterium minor TaxID=2316528 RepID=A0A4Q2UEP8_9HYPH|nr:class I SAM-dependent methyltransferase [Lichenibacterium minor]RYC33791.1 class I SAM-dependent methyltransferase [Lichenibacterium minor]